MRLKWNSAFYHVSVGEFSLTWVGDEFYCGIHKIGFNGEVKEYLLACAPQEQFNFFRKQQETAIMLLSRWQYRSKDLVLPPAQQSETAITLSKRRQNQYLSKDILKLISTFILYTADPNQSHTCKIKWIPLSSALLVLRDR